MTAATRYDYITDPSVDGQERVTFAVTMLIREEELACLAHLCLIAASVPKVKHNPKLRGEAEKFAAQFTSARAASSGSAASANTATEG